jgi:hypothetical protein
LFTHLCPIISFDYQSILVGENAILEVQINEWIAREGRKMKKE